MPIVKAIYFVYIQLPPSFVKSLINSALKLVLFCLRFSLKLASKVSSETVLRRTELI